MFIKPFPKYNKTTKQRYTIYRLCESFRINGRIHHRTIIGFGKLDELPEVEQKKQLAARIEEILVYRTNTLAIDPVDKTVEKLARHYYNEIKTKQRYDIKSEEQEWEIVDMASLKNSDAREVGAEWLCKQALDQLGIKRFLQQQNWTDENVSLACTHIISRSVYPASELKTTSYIK